MGCQSIQITITIKVSKRYAVSQGTVQLLATVAEGSISIIEPDLVGIATGNCHKGVQVAIAIHSAEGKVVNVDRCRR